MKFVCSTYNFNASRYLEFIIGIFFLYSIKWFLNFSAGKILKISRNVSQIGIVKSKAALGPLRNLGISLTPSKITPFGKN